MFKTGFKQIVLNSDPGFQGVDIATGVIGGAPATGTGIQIPGFATISSDWAGVTEPIIVTGMQPQAGIFSIDFDTLAKAPVAGDVVDVILKISAESFRALSEMFSYGELKLISARITNPAAMAADFVNAWKAWNLDGDEFFSRNIFDLEVGTGNVLRIVIKKGYEGYQLQDALFTIVSDENPKQERMSYATPLDSNMGINSGKEIETEVRNAQFENIDPYGIHFGGNDQNVDVRGVYNSYHFTTDKDQEKGWEPHAGLGYGDANTETTYVPRDYIVYALQGSSADLAMALWAV